MAGWLEESKIRLTQPSLAGSGAELGNIFIISKYIVQRSINMNTITFISNDILVRSMTFTSEDIGYNTGLNFGLPPHSLAAVKLVTISFHPVNPLDS